MRKKISLFAVLFLTAFVFMAGYFGSVGATSLDDASLVNMLKIKIAELQSLLVSRNYSLYGSVLKSVDSDGGISFTGTSTSPSIKVIYPNGGETLKIGESYKIKWTPGSPGMKKIDLLNADKEYVYTIYSYKVYGYPVPNTSGIFNWTIPYSIKSGSYYLRLYANSVEDNNIDYSDSSFKIVSSSKTGVNIIYPNGGETISTGSTQKIKWSSSGFSKYAVAKIELRSSDQLASNDSSGSFIGAAKVSDGSFNWKVSKSLKNNKYIVVISVMDGGSKLAVYDASDSPFTISNLSSLPGKVVVSNAVDPDKIYYNQGVLSPLNGVILGSFDFYAKTEDMKLTDLTIDLKSDGVAKKNAVSALGLYLDNGDALSSLVPDIYPSDVPADTFVWKSTDFLSDVIVPKNSHKKIVIRGNISSNANDSQKMYLSLDNNPGWLKFIGVDSGVVYDATKDMSSPVTSKITTPYAGGSFNFNKDIVEIKKSLISPSGVVSRGTQIQYAIWDVMNVSSDLSDNFINSITFKSKTGLPLGLSSLDKDIFALYDGDGNLICRDGVGGCVVSLNQSSGMVKFQKTNMLKVSAGIPKKISLRINTTDVSKWPSGVQSQWSIESYLDVSLDKGHVGFGGNTWSIPAVTNLITLP